MNISLYMCFIVLPLIVSILYTWTTRKKSPTKKTKKVKEKQPKIKN